MSELALRELLQDERATANRPLAKSLRILRHDRLGHDCRRENRKAFEQRGVGLAQLDLDRLRIELAQALDRCEEERVEAGLGIKRAAQRKQDVFGRDRRAVTEARVSQ